MKPCKDGVIFLTDASVIQLLMTLGHPIDELVRESGTVWFGFEESRVRSTLYAFEHNIPIPCDDIRRMILAMSQFKTIIRRPFDFSNLELDA